MPTSLLRLPQIRGLQYKIDKLVSWVGRDVLIKVVAQAIPPYIMSIFKLPKKLSQSIQSTIIRFWWGHN